MIKMMMTREDGRKILGIIITKGNVNKLMEDQPIHFNREDMKLPSIKVDEVFIAYAETEVIAIKMFEDGGLISEETIIHDDRKSTKQ